MDAITIGTVHLNVANLEGQVAFYRDIIGLREHRCESDTVYLGTGQDDLLALHHHPDYQRVDGLTGLYHVAILLPSRRDLGLVLKHLVETETPLQGMSDHLVSEAIYLSDPEGNGIEIYRDLPRGEWPRGDNGTIQMATLPMDYQGVLAAADADDAAFSGLPEGTIVGHVHLKVASIPQAKAFYRDVLGMDLLFDVGSAAFLSYNGYHHHVGVNVWEGRNLPTQPVQGLAKVVLHVGEALDSILAKITASGIDFDAVDAGYLVQDPSRNLIMLAR